MSRKLVRRVGIVFTVLLSIWAVVCGFVIIALDQFDKQLFLMKPK